MPKSVTTPITRRRVLLAGAGTAGALAAAASVVPRTPDSPGAAARGKAGAPDEARGYRVTQHVLHYYQTAKV